jgi:hypothetical protein
MESTLHFIHTYLDLSLSLGEIASIGSHNLCLSYYHNVGQNHNLIYANISFENVAKFKYLGGKLTNFSLMKILGAEYIQEIIATVLLRVFFFPSPL